VTYAAGTSSGPAVCGCASRSRLAAPAKIVEGAGFFVRRAHGPAAPHPAGLGPGRAPLW